MGSLVLYGLLTISSTYLLLFAGASYLYGQVTEDAVVRFWDDYRIWGPITLVIMTWILALWIGGEPVIAVGILIVGGLFTIKQALILCRRMKTTFDKLWG